MQVTGNIRNVDLSPRHFFFSIRFFLKSKQTNFLTSKQNNKMFLQSDSVETLHSVVNDVFPKQSLPFKRNLQRTKESTPSDSRKVISCALLASLKR